MNIIYNHRTQCKGVEGVHILEMVKALTRLNNQVDIVSPAGTKKADSEGKAPPTGKALKVHSFISKCFPEFFFELSEIMYNFSAAKKLQTLLRQKKYDLIYERYAIFNWSGSMAAKKYNIPIILEINYTSFTALYRKRSEILRPFAHWIDKKIFARAGGFVVVSSCLKQHLIDLGVAAEKIIVLTNAADPEKFDPAISAERLKEKYNLGHAAIIGFVGGFFPWHGLDLLIDCFAELEHRQNDIRLLLIGDGPVMNDIKVKTRGLNIEDKVLFLGRVSPESMPEYMVLFDVAVMPDSNTYGSPMKIFEYMAMAKPVIAPRLGPLEDGIQDGKEGILFEQGNKEALSKAMKTLIEDKALRSRMGRAGRENVIARHTWSKNAEGVLALFSQSQKLNRV